MLVTMKEILKIAEEKEIAIGAFNAANLESLTAEVEAAEALDLPIIIQFAQCHEPWIPINTIGPIMLMAAKSAKVPICIHLDHGETLEYVENALNLGFTSVMYDGSTLEYSENLENTKKTVEMAKKHGASVEAELGSMGVRESGAGDGSGNDDATKIYTAPELASAFVRDTGIDALACSFGTTHGIYLTEPKLDFDVVKNVRAKTDNIPVVMHGGSGVSREDYHKAIKAGVRKINYFTYMDKAGGAAVVKLLEEKHDDTPVFFSALSMCGRDAMRENVTEAMKMFAFIE